MLRIFITSQSRYPTDMKALREKVRVLLRDQGVTDCEVSIALVGERKIKELSQVYLNEENGVHEVLSFPYREGDDFPAHPERHLQLGDVVICYPEARKIAMKKNKLMDDVIQELAEHGVLHLLGVHHE